MLTVLTSLALIGLAIHTKYIYQGAMEEMFAESRNETAGHRLAPRPRSGRQAR